MIAKINNYLLQNYPKLWKSNIHWSLLSTFMLSIIFLLFADNFDTELYEYMYSDGEYCCMSENDDSLYFGDIPIFLWLGIVVYWLYTQYKNRLPLKRFTFTEILSFNILNLFSVVITVIPVLILINLGVDKENSFENTMEVLGFFISIGLVPIVFSSLIIKNFSLIEILLTILFGFLYCLFTAFVWFQAISESDASIIIFFSINYLILFFVIIIKFTNHQYNQLDKRLALALIFYTPWFIGMNLVEFFHFVDNSNFEERVIEFCIHLGISLTLLSIISWLVTKSIQKPITIK